MNYIVKNFNELCVDELYDILKVRSEVFVVEQNCVYQDMDDIDKQALHFYIKEDNKILAYLRAYKSENDFLRLGRILSTQRGKGYGEKIVKFGIEESINYFSCNSIYIEAQCYAQMFYEKFGFIAFGESFLEDGIPHIKMILDV